MIQSFYSDMVVANQTSKHRELTLHLHIVSTSRSKATGAPKDEEEKEDGQGQIAHKIIKQGAISEQASRPVRLTHHLFSTPAAASLATR